MIYYPYFLVRLVSFRVILRTLRYVIRYVACFSYLLRFLKLCLLAFRLIVEELDGCLFEIVYELFVRFLAACIYLLSLDSRCLPWEVLLRLLQVLYRLVSFLIASVFRWGRCDQAHEIKSYVLDFERIFRAFLSIQSSCLGVNEPNEAILEVHLIIIIFLKF